MFDSGVYHQHCCQPEEDPDELMGKASQPDTDHANSRIGWNAGTWSAKKSA